MWRTMNIEERELHYSCSRWTHRGTADETIQTYIQNTQRASEEARARVVHKLGEVYGATDNQKFDIYAPEHLATDAPIFVYLHGGYWQEGGREMSAFMAGSLTDAGAVVVVVGYDLAPQATVPDIVNQVKRAVRHSIHTAKRRGSRGVYLCGHSAGAQLAALMIATDWVKELMEDSSLIKGAILLSGIFDLRPLVGTYINEALRMTETEAWENSPARYVDRICSLCKHMDILVGVAQHDPPEFHRQADQFTQELQAGGLEVHTVEIPDVDHFSFIEKLDDPDYSLTKDIIKVMKLQVS